MTALLVMLALAPPAPLVAAQDTTTRALAAAVRTAVTADRLAAHAREITRHERPSGSHGENAAIDYIVATLRAAGVPVEVHTFDAYTSDPVRARVEVVGDASFTADAITASFSASAAALEAPLVDLGPLDDLPRLEAGTGELLLLEGELGGDPGLDRFRHVAGAIALVDGQPRNVPVTVLARLGAVGVVFANPEERLNDLIVTSTWGTPSLRNAHRLETLPVAQIRRSAGAALRERLARGPVRVRLTAETRTGWTPLRLAVARVPGPAPDAPSVLLGGHIDAWYHGGTDEGASNAAMLELALAFHAERHRLRRGLVVAWWPGHSNARYGGSTWFADHFYEELRHRTLAYLNIDGVGQVGASRFGASATPSLEALARRVVRERTGEDIRVGRPGRNSDQSFNGIGMPLLQLDHTRLAGDGGYWWWHTPDDTYDKIDPEVLEIDTGLYVDALAELLAARVAPVDIVAEVEALGQAIADRDAQAGGRVDFEAARLGGERLLEAARRVETERRRRAAAGEAGSEPALLRILRPLYRVLREPLDPVHPDPGVDGSALPGLSPVSILASAPPQSDRYRFAVTSIQRELNRLVEAIEEARLEAERFLRERG